MQEFDFIETPENVELQRRLAGIGTRFIAGLVDHILIAGVYLVLFLFTWLAASVDLIEEFRVFKFWLYAAVVLAAFLIYWGYFVFFEMATNGQSPGKRSQKIRVVKEGGGSIGFVDVAVRNLLRAVDAMAFYGVGGISMFMSRKVQRLGDLAAGTVVVSEMISDYAARTDKKHKTDWEHEASAQELRATGLSPEDFGILNNYWQRRNELTREAREKLLRNLIVPILRRAGRALTDESAIALEMHVEQLMAMADVERGARQDSSPFGDAPQ